MNSEMSLMPARLIHRFNFCLAAIVCFIMGFNRLEAQPLKVMAMMNTQPSNLGEVPNNPSDSIQFYDVTDIEAGGAVDVFNNQPLFSVWMGYDRFLGEQNDLPEGIAVGNREEASALAVNPVNGTIYAASFDSGIAPFVNPSTNQVQFVPDETGDGQGDFDLYRIDYQTILKDFVDNSRPMGTIYGRDQMPIVISDEDFLSDMDGLGASPLYDGVIDGVANNVPHPSGANTVHVPGTISKVGEVGRVQSAEDFFDVRLDFVDPSTLVFFDSNHKVIDRSEVEANPAADDNTDFGDFQVRVWERVSRSPGQATASPKGPDNAASTINGAGQQPEDFDNHQGGYNGQPLVGGQPSQAWAESWESTTLGPLELDSNSDSSVSEPSGWAFVKRDGVMGVWVADGDQGETDGADGDDIAFYQIDLSGPTPTLTKKPLAGTALGNVLQIDDDPSVSTATNDGNVDALRVDANGNLVIIEADPYFGGDFNGDNQVNLADYTLWRDNLGNPSDEVIGNQGDEVDGVTVADYEVWKANFDRDNGKVITVAIDSYDTNGEVVPVGGSFDDAAAYTVSDPLPVSGFFGNDNDPNPVDNSRIVYDPGTGLIYFIDRDFVDLDGDDSADEFPEDIYVFDPATGQIVYSELTTQFATEEEPLIGPFNPGIINAGTQLLILRGDVNEDGVVDADDVTALNAAIADPTIGGLYASDVGAEYYDLTGDLMLDNNDLLELQSILASSAIAGISNLAVPEPGSWLLMGSLTLLTVAARRK